MTKAEAARALKAWRTYCNEQAQQAQAPVESRHWAAQARSATVWIQRLKEEMR
jgi:hypothetical protein